MKKALAIVLIVLGTIAVLGCTESPEYSESGKVAAPSSERTESPEYSESGKAAAPSSELEILEHHGEIGEYGNLYVVGQAKNTGSKSLSYAEIRVKFYDADGNLLGSSFDNINDLGAGETWRFKVIYMGMDTEKVSSYKIAAGTTI